MTILITGASSGIGLAAAEALAGRGHTVYDLSRHGQTARGITHIDCDVTSSDDCQRAVGIIISQGHSIDCLISNAGMGISGAVEFTDTAEMRRQFDVNLFGAVNIAQAVLPHMRQQRHGRIIFVSSVAAVFAIPFQAFYSASKAALSALAMALRNEVAPFGITVGCLLPGDVKTGFTDARAKAAAGSDVYTHMQKAVQTMEHDEQHGIDPKRMAQTLVSMAESRSLQAFTTTGWQYHLFLLLNKIVPATLAYKIVGKMY